METWKMESLERQVQELQRKLRDADSRLHMVETWLYVAGMVLAAAYFVGLGALAASE